MPRVVKSLDLSQFSRSRVRFIRKYFLKGLPRGYAVNPRTGEIRRDSYREFCGIMNRKSLGFAVRYVCAFKSSLSKALKDAYSGDSDYDYSYMAPIFRKTFKDFCFKNRRNPEKCRKKYDELVKASLTVRSFKPPM